jgi:hypothetical protein
MNLQRDGLIGRLAASLRCHRRAASACMMNASFTEWTAGA